MGLVFTNDACIGCNKCIRVCSVMGACKAVIVDGIPRIEVDDDKCIGCGACIDACEHHAREFNDDTLRFFEDLKKEKRFLYYSHQPSRPIIHLNMSVFWVG